MKTEIKRTNSSNADFISLVAELDAALKIIDGDDHGFYDQFNKIDNIKNVVVLYENGSPLACGAFKPHNDNQVEIKRMYSQPAARGKGLASKVLLELENWAAELNFKRCVLETGERQIEALALYNKNGYKIIPNYGQYVGIKNSVCFGKNLLN
ncbi:Acetyltransferase (GNAT) family protein [Spirosomataceae bacterium TFI 002]|nr:Acetyltransferase (GNAT) family protein [Spirosomataceae bacterium TFI 002]